MSKGGRLVVEKSETMPLRGSDDVVRARQMVRAKAVEAGFGIVDQTKLVTGTPSITAAVVRCASNSYARDRAVACS